MKSLQNIQKTLRVFQILSKIAMIVSFAWAASVSAIFPWPQNAGSDWSNLPSLILGIGLILVSLIFRYGAELEKNNNL